VFLGSPKEFSMNTRKLTGKSPMPPLWSFGLWMSRCTYSAEQQVRRSRQMREKPDSMDVLHLDTGG